MAERTAEELAAAIVRLAELEDGATYRDPLTGWVGRLVKPQTVQGVQWSAKDGRPRVDLMGASPKDDRDLERRSAFLDDIERVDGDPVGFGGLTDG